MLTELFLNCKIHNNTNTKGEKLKDLSKLRKDKEMTQLDVAKLCGVTLNAYANWERGANKPSDDNLKKLKKIFKIKG